MSELEEMMSCRACGICIEVSSKRLESIFSDEVSECLKEMRSWNIIILENDNLPQHICDQCVERFRSLHQFRLSNYRSLKIFHALHAAKIRNPLTVKTEPVEMENLQENENENEMMPLAHVENDKVMEKTTQRNVDTILLYYRKYRKCKPRLFRLYRCKCCIYMVRTKLALRSHMQIHNFVSCDICSKFVLCGQLSDHMDNHQSCNDSFNTDEESLDDNNFANESDGFNEYDNNVVSASDESNEEEPLNDITYKKHANVSDNVDSSFEPQENKHLSKTLIQCNFCTKSCKSYFHLKRHMEKQHRSYLNHTKTHEENIETIQNSMKMIHQ